jgi:hypothetical protein
MLILSSKFYSNSSFKKMLPQKRSRQKRQSAPMELAARAATE